MKVGIRAAINKLVPQADCSLRRQPGESDETMIDNIEWRDPRPMPSKAEILAKYQELQDAITAQKAVKEAVKTDTEVVNAIDVLATSTPQQIENWVDNNVNNINSAKRVLGIILKILAMKARKKTW